MKQPPRIGLSGEKTILVNEDNRISFVDQRMPSILSTPWLIAHLEYTARDTIAPLLNENERSVGTYVEVEHLAPAPEGFTVTCRARVIHVDGTTVSFQVEAHDGFDMISKGIHRRCVIDVDRFRRRVEKKIERANS